MRLSHLALIGLIALPLPAMAQVPAGKTIFGSYTCPTKVPCDDLALSSEQWAAVGSQCISKAFRYQNPDGFFEPLAGLNSSKCLTARPNSINNTVGSPLVPYCCVVTINNTCHMNCKLAN